MPNREPVVAQQDQIRIRHIGPEAAVWPGAPVNLEQFTVLSQSTMVARRLPISSVPATRDFVSGSWTLRLDDAGEASLIFPNTDASDGLPWRSRFDVTGHLQFLEIYFNGELDHVGVIDQTTPSQPSVTVHTDDGWWLLKKAYVRDWTVTQAPRDVIERGTNVSLPVAASDFPVGYSLTTAGNGRFSAGASTGASVVIGQSGGAVMSIPATTAGSAPGIASLGTLSPAGVGGNAWRATVSITGAVPSAYANLYLQVIEIPASGFNSEWTLFLTPTTARLDLTVNTVQADTVVTVPSAVSYDLMLESDGEWVTAFCNGQLVGCFRRPNITTTRIQMEVVLSDQSSIPANPAVSVTVSNAYLSALQPFLMRGSDTGDYVLPGDQTTYPSGGLSARYFNDADLSGLSGTAYLQQVLSPTRQQSYGGSSPAEYADQQDAGIIGQTNPAGASNTYWSCRWFGSIYLKLSEGNYGFEVFLPNIGGGDSAVRVWIGQTEFGTQLVEEWTFSTGGPYTFTVSAAALAGTLPNGAGTVIRDGWYPIKVDFAYGAPGTDSGAPTLSFAPPVSYVDPGGTSLSGGTAVPVPSTSLSPLGCIDQRYQGISHFDLIQQTLQATGLHATVEPKQLESGLFPGVLAPRIREGHDTDIVLSADRASRTDGEGILNYSSTLDSTDFASSIQGNGAGVQTGSTGQLQTMVYDPTTLQSSLFDAQAWQDNSDAGLPALLQALLNSELALSLEPWQSLSADPSARPRRAFTWPLPGAVQNMRWRPGDGVFVRERTIDVYDTEPRQMLVVTRNISPQGIQGSQATFANRPRNPARALKKQLFSATRQQRNYQRQMVSLTGESQLSSIAAGTTDTGLSIVPLLAGDRIVTAVVHAAIVGSGSVGVVVNGSSYLPNGPWSGSGLNLDVSSLLTVNPASNNNAYVQLTNPSGSTVLVRYQLAVTVLR